MHDVTFIAAYKSCSLPFTPQWMYMFISPTLILLTLISTTLYIICLVMRNLLEIIYIYLC